MKRAPIVEVELCGFKGFDRVFALKSRNLLSGLNGVGKSAVLQAIKFALTGHVTTGKTKDAVAKYFPPRGGHVRLEDADGHSITRRLLVDHEKRRVSMVVELSGDDTMELWATSDTTLEIENFLKKSAEKRREFVLELVGGGEAPGFEEMRVLIASHYAKQIAGEAATIETLASPEDLSDEVRELAEQWSRTNWAILETYIAHPSDAASIWVRLATAARDRKNECRRAALDAQSAVRELEAEAKGARAAAAHVEKRAKLRDELGEKLKLLQSREALYREKKRALDSATRERAEREKECAEAQEMIENDVGDRPDLSAMLETATRALDECDERLSVARAQARTVGVLERHWADYQTHKRKLAELREEKNAQHDLPIGRLIEAYAKLRPFIPDGPADDHEEHFSKCLDEVASSWNDRMRLLEGRIDRLTDEIDRLAKSLPGGQPKMTLQEAQEQVAELELEQAGLLKALDDAKSAHAREKALREQIEWHKKNVKTAKRAISGMSERIKQLERELKGFPETDAKTLEEEFEQAESELAAAQKAAGAVLAYERATDRAKSQSIAAKSWAAVERAVQRAREIYVAEIVSPIVSDMQQLLDHAERRENVYLLLENDRGAPIFDLGWDRGEDRCSLDALSDGEAVLFVTALALAIAKRTEQRRLLLVEADNLDEQALLRYCEAVSAMKVKLDAVLVATNRAVKQSLKNWRVVLFEGGDYRYVDKGSKKRKVKA